MITLLLDSSGTNMSVGLAENHVLLGAIEEVAWQQQSELMVARIDELLVKHNVDRLKIDEIIVGIGPGSYTGVRIGVTIAKVIAVSLNIPVYPVSSLQIMEGNVRPSVSVMNARRNRSYVGVYFEGAVILEDQIMENADLFNYLNEHPDYLLTGDVAYLDKVSAPFNRFINMLKLRPTLVAHPNVLALAPRYLKD